MADSRNGLGDFGCDDVMERCIKRDRYGEWGISLTLSTVMEKGRHGWKVGSFAVSEIEW